jgi:hypothetical protein
MQWEKVEPVLRATYAVLERNEKTTGEEVLQEMGRDLGDGDAARAFRELGRDGFINASFKGPGGLPFLIRTTERGLQHCAGWPTPGSSSTFMDEFLRAIDERVQDTATPKEQRGHLSEPS